MQLIKSMLTTCEFYTCKKILKINIFVHLKKKSKDELFQPLYSKRHVSFSHLHPDHYNWWKNLWLGKKIKIIASHDRTLRSCEAAASIVHVINTPADMQLWKHLFFLLNFKACAVPLHTDSWSSVLTKPHKKKKSQLVIFVRKWTWQIWI